MSACGLDDKDADALAYINIAPNRILQMNLSYNKLTILYNEYVGFERMLLPCIMKTAVCIAILNADNIEVPENRNMDSHKVDYSEQ